MTYSKKTFFLSSFYFETLWLTFTWIPSLQLKSVCVFSRTYTEFSPHCSTCWLNMTDWIHFPQLEHCMAAQFLNTFFKFFIFSYFYSSNLHLCSIFYRAADMFLLASTSSVLQSPSVDANDCWRATSRVSCNRLFSLRVFFKKETWFSK